MSVSSQFDFSTAQRMLTDANQHFAALLPAVDGQPNRDASVSGHAQAYIAAVQGLQQQLAAFAAPASATPKAALEQQVAALQQELSRADALLQETSARVQEWQMRCQDLRSQHEAVLTSGIGVQTMPTVAPNQQDAQMEEAAQ